MSRTNKEIIDEMFQDCDPRDLEFLNIRPHVTKDGQLVTKQMREAYFDAHGMYSDDAVVYDWYWSTGQENDVVNNPPHYTVGGIETIDYMKVKSTKEEFCGHLRLTAIKYLSRAGYKDDALQDFQKAQWYINRLVEELKEDS